MPSQSLPPSHGPSSRPTDRGPMVVRGWREIVVFRFLFRPTHSAKIAGATLQCDDCPSGPCAAGPITRARHSCRMPLWLLLTHLMQVRSPLRLLPSACQDAARRGPADDRRRPGAPGLRALRQLLRPGVQDVNVTIQRGGPVPWLVSIAMDGGAGISADALWYRRPARCGGCAGAPHQADSAEGQRGVVGGCCRYNEINW